LLSTNVVSMISSNKLTADAYTAVKAITISLVVNKNLHTNNRCGFEKK
jgi:hypothetical protein